MFYTSTRDKSVRVTAAEAIAKGISSEGGLFVPTEIPEISAEFIEKLVPMTYIERAKEVLETVSGLSAEDETAVRMLHFYEMILNGADLSSLVREADKLKAQARTNVI